MQCLQTIYCRFGEFYVDKCGNILSVGEFKMYRFTINICFIKIDISGLKILFFWKH